MGVGVTVGPGSGMVAPLGTRMVISTRRLAARPRSLGSPLGSRFGWTGFCAPKAMMRIWSSVSPCSISQSATACARSSDTHVDPVGAARVAVPAQDHPLDLLPLIGVEQAVEFSHRGLVQLGAAGPEGNRGPQRFERDRRPLHFDVGADYRIVFRRAVARGRARRWGRRGARLLAVASHQQRAQRQHNHRATHGHPPSVTSSYQLTHAGLGFPPACPGSRLSDGFLPASFCPASRLADSASARLRCWGV